MITPETRLLRAFVTVAEDLHFGRAAARLNIVQPALSMQLIKLEETLGVKLLHRTRRSVALTEPGRLFLDDARRILRQLDLAVDLVKRVDRGEAGRLRIGYSIATAYSGLLSRVLGSFHQASPNVALEVHEMHPALQRKALLDDELDVGFVAADAAIHNEAFDSRVVESWTMILALPASHPLAGESVVSLEALKEETFISYEALGEDLGIDAYRITAGSPPRAVRHVESPVMLLALVGAGLGIATVPDALRSTAPPSVVFVAADRPFTEVQIVALFRRDNRNAALMRFVKEVLEPISDKNS